MRVLKSVAFIMTIGLVIPAVGMADEAKPAVKTAKQKITDVSLRADGILIGHVVNAQGEPIPSAQVKVIHGRDVIAKVSSDRNGGFIVRRLRGGVHQVVAGQGSQIVRLWTAKAAPPASMAKLTIVSDKSVVRGQCGDAGCAGGCGEGGCGEGGFLGGSGGGLGGGGGFLGLSGGGLAGTIAAAAVVGGVLAATLDDDDPASP